MLIHMCIGDKLQAYLCARVSACSSVAWCARILGLRVTCGWVSPCVCCVRAQCACVEARVMGLHLPTVRDVDQALAVAATIRTTAQACSVHLRIVFASGHAQIGTFMRMSCA